ncbi:MAG: DNA-3-methyladenine glycosylase [Bacteroidota bacterium]
METKLKRDYYSNEDVVFLAKDLIGKVLCTNIQGQYSAGIISETEAYKGPEDRASHAYGNKRTNRTEIMFGEPGFAYVYLCYGIHKLFNVVSGPKDIPHAVLIRGTKPLEGIPIMEKRRSMKSTKKNFSSGPGTLTIALGLNMHHNKMDLEGDEVWIEDRNIPIKGSEIIQGPRIGIDYSGPDKDLPYRFLWKLAK